MFLNVIFYLVIKYVCNYKINMETICQEIDPFQLQLGAAGVGGGALCNIYSIFTVIT